MKVKKLINLLKDYEDFEVESIPLFLKDDSFNYGIGCYNIYLNGVIDINYIDKKIDLNVDYNEIRTIVDDLISENNDLKEINKELKEYNKELKNVINDC